VGAVRRIDRWDWLQERLERGRDEGDQGEDALDGGGAAMRRSPPTPRGRRTRARGELTSCAAQALCLAGDGHDRACRPRTCACGPPSSWSGGERRMARAAAIQGIFP